MSWSSALARCATGNGVPRGGGGAIAALVVRGPVRVMTALALRRQCFLPRALYLHDPEAWYTMREQLTFRREARRKQLRFRKDPAAYLAALEEILLKTSLPFSGFFEDSGQQLLGVLHNPFGRFQKRCVLIPSNCLRLNSY